ncbi:acyl-CoA dehydrogenase family protein [Bremerella sp. P1]|uniref:acyl-CoA dehydrogenase family protein n=1 Tax=Bremerella sp. P1 TaxID=3026424 RepID=UPI002367B708|nr:acyl-CoA dehydrogenase family protein [Bremerella sp. P1]WDI40249.1 acyl-CoA/acyl-ACP dehydrogenase [Bremerella sp. P1]
MSSDTTNPQPPETKPEEQQETSFAETALKLGGKSEDEARRTGAIDSADDQVEKLFQPQYQTANSPAHRAVWDRGIPVELFEADPVATPPEIRKVMDDSLEVVRGFRKSKAITDDKGKIRDEVLQSLGDAGYWGLLVDKKYGGSGTPFRAFAPFLTEMAMVDPTLAGLASVHGCIGAVDPVSTFGSEEQKQRYLPKLASGEKLSAFALTEPCAGSDLTALRTHAKLDGDSYVLNGEKLFITNVVPGRTIGVVCLIDDVPAVLVVDLPPEENDNFQLRKYGIWALKHTYNQGIIFKDFRVPKENLLVPGKGNGLTIAYHGLNLGRISLCANAAGTMRLMMASMIPWVHFRETYGEPIAKRELVQRRLGKLAGMIVASDALVAWCSTLIDAGYRGEMECIIAKIFGSESQKEAAIELFMKTHGGRSFLHGHMFGDNVHEYLAPCIYEGEGEMLGMAFFKSLVKKHGTQFFEPIGKALHEAGIKKPNPFNPAHAWALKGALAPYASWMMKEYMGGKPRPKFPQMPEDLKAHAQFAADRLQDMPLHISGTMRKHQLKLADRQCRMSYLSANVQDLMTILCTALYAAKQENETVRAAADIACRDLKRKILLTRPSDRYFRRVSEVGGMIAEGNFPGVDVPPDEIMMRYDK